MNEAEREDIRHKAGERARESTKRRNAIRRQQNKRPDRRTDLRTEYMALILGAAALFAIVAFIWGATR